MAQATSGEKLITVDGEKYKVRTQVVYQDGLGIPGTLSTTAPIRYTIEYKPLSPSPLQQWITLGERDNTNQNNWIFTPAAGAGFQKALIANGPNSLTTSLDDAASNALSKSSGVTKQQANQVLQVAPNVVPTAAAPVQPAPVQPVLNGPAAPTDPVPNDPVNIEDPGITALGSRENYDNYYYPKTLRGNQNKQDIIKFTAFSYGSRNLTVQGVQGSSKNSFGTPGLGERTFGEIKGSVTLPIQPSITDTNTVEWGGENLNPLQAFGAAVSYGAQTDIAGAAQQLGNQTEKLFRDSNFKNAARIFLAGKAVGVNGLLSRIGGAVLNPNMELLFQGPQLRPFSFTFRLSPRDRDEAKQVKYIIRFFKQNMSIKNTADNIFLKAPNIFEIKYINGVTGNDHTSLNRIKRCALQSCSVDYTPDGSYMTFNDPDSGYPMTSYNLTLQFQELEPVTEKDYNDLNDINAIGY